jgi:hypothetical protein
MSMYAFYLFIMNLFFCTNLGFSYIKKIQSYTKNNYANEYIHHSPMSMFGRGLTWAMQRALGQQYCGLCVAGLMTGLMTGF